MSRILRFFGDEFTWIRIVGAFFGAFAAAITTLAAEKLFDTKLSSLISLLSVAAPQTALYSVRFLKENWVIFAVSLIVFGFTAIIRNKKVFSAALPIIISAIILFWIRFEYGLISVAAIPIAVFFRSRISSTGKTAIIISVIIFALTISLYQYGQLKQKAETMAGRYALMERGQRGNVETVAILDKMYKSHGPLRLLNIPLSALNPPPKKLHHIFAPANGLHDIVLQADIWQWWLGLPFLIIGAFRIIKKRADFLVFLVPYIVVIVISATLYGGLQTVVYRFRDSLAPMAFIIIGAGIESLMTEQRQWKNIIILSVYAAFALLAVCLYIKGF